MKTKIKRKGIFAAMLVAIRLFSILPDMPSTDSQYSASKILNNNLVNAPAVIYNKPSSMEAIQELINDSVTSSILLDLKLENLVLNAYSDTQKVGTISEVSGAASGKIIIMYSISDEKTADALTDYIAINSIEDLNVVSDDAELLANFRSKAVKTRATLVLNSKKISVRDTYSIVSDANTAKCMSVIISQSAASKAIVEAIQSRMISVWVISDDTAVGMHKAITSGANGILTQNPTKLAQEARLYDSPTLTRRSFVIGHRGIPSSAPENTMASYKAALEQGGADMLEADVFLTKDKKIILLHDKTFLRTTDILTNKTLPDSLFTEAGITRETCTPGDLTLEQIKLLDAGSWFSPSFAGEKIPTLNELLEYMKGKDVILALELKDTSAGIEQACLDIIKKYDFFNQVNIITFNQKSLEIIKSIAPSLSAATLSGITYPDAANPQQAIHDVLNSILPINAAYDPSFDYLHNEDFINSATARGLELWGWTYTDRTDFALAIDHGITGLTNNNSDWSKDYAFTLNPEKNQYTLKVGDSLAVHANAVTNLNNIISRIPEVLVIDGEDKLHVDGNTITALKSGTATILMRTFSIMGSSVYEIYTQPVIIQIKN